MLEVPLALSPTVLAVGVVIAVILLARRSLAAEQRHMERQLQELIRLKRMELELVAYLQAPHIELEAGGALDAVGEATIRAIVEEISAGPYSPHHIRDLPPPVRRLQWDTPHGPVTVVASARPRGRRSRYGWGLAAIPTVGALSEWAARGTTTAQAAVVATSSAALIAVAPAVPMPWLRPHPAPTEVSRDRSGPVPGGVATTPVAQTGPAVQADEDEQPEPDETTTETPEPTPTPTPITTPTPAPTGTPTATPAPTVTGPSQGTATPTPEPSTPADRVDGSPMPEPTTAPSVPDPSAQPAPPPGPGFDASLWPREPRPGKRRCHRHGVRPRGHCYRGW